MHHTQDEEHLHCYVTAYSAAADKWVMVAALVGTDKADVVRYGDGNIKGRQQNEPVPEGLRDAVVKQDETWLLHGRNLVLR